MYRWFGDDIDGLVTCNARPHGWPISVSDMCAMNLELWLLITFFLIWIKSATIGGCKFNPAKGAIYDKLCLKDVELLPLGTTSWILLEILM